MDGLIDFARRKKLVSATTKVLSFDFFFSIFIQSDISFVLLLKLYHFILNHTQYLHSYLGNPSYITTMAFKFNSSLVLFSVIFLCILDGSVALKFLTGTKSEPMKAFFCLYLFPKGVTLTSLPEPSMVESLDKNIVESDLMAFVRTLPPDQSGIYSQAFELLNSMQASPSCNRLAALTLLNSCQTIEGSAHDHEGSLDDIKSTYAAQLAICEISITGLKIPQECEPLNLIVDKDRIRSGHSSEGSAKPGSGKKIRKRHLSQCVRSLESRPQWWTSYSNSRQNAVVMCQAARADIDKGILMSFLSITYVTYKSQTI